MRKRRSTANGALRTHSHVVISTSSSARPNPTIGDRKIADTVLITPCQTIAALPALAMPAPSSPPISACELDEGMPPHHVMRFQAMAPVNAPNITCMSTTPAETMPVPIVCAT